MVLQGEIAKVLPGSKRVHRLEALNDDHFFLIGIDQLVDLLMQLELAVVDLSFKYFGGLCGIESTICVHWDLMVVQLVSQCLDDAGLPVDCLPVDVVVVLDDEVEKAKRRGLFVLQLDWHGHADVHAALNDDVKVIARVAIVEDSLARCKLLESQVLAELLVCLLISRLLYLFKELVVLEQLLGLPDLRERAELRLEGQDLADHVHFVPRDPT